MSDSKRKEKNKDTDEMDSFNPERLKGPQKEEHTNQYGDQDDAEDPKRKS